MTIAHISLLIIGLAIISGLAVWAWSLTQKVKQREQEILSNVKERHDKIIESIRVIANAFEDQQVEMIEASIRLKVLLDNLPLSEEEKKPYAVFEVIYEKVAHIPTHENWKALSRKEKAGFQKEMSTVEKEYKDLFADAAKQLKQHAFEFKPSVKFN
jgi:hypothetical protein